jgi:hypothetical protein
MAAIALAVDQAGVANAHNPAIASDWPVPRNSRATRYISVTDKAVIHEAITTSTAIEAPTMSPSKSRCATSRRSFSGRCGISGRIELLGPPLSLE